jgi:hypothetical protein
MALNGAMMQTGKPPLRPAVLLAGNVWSISRSPIAMLSRCSLSFGTLPGRAEAVDDAPLERAAKL